MAASSTNRIAIIATSSRLSKGLLAIPQRFVHLLPREKCQIQVRLGNEVQSKPLAYKPYDEKTKEARIFGLGKWFTQAGIQGGDVIYLILEDQEKLLYRIAQDKLLRAEEEVAARIRLESAQTESGAEREFKKLTRLTKKRSRELAQEELLRIAAKDVCKLRPRSTAAPLIRSEGVPAGIRVLLRELHDGKCQLCAFTFQKKNGEPYFEIHHLDPTLGHHPQNLLVVCPNCHAQFEHAKVGNFVWSGNWLVSVTINDKTFSVRQPHITDLTRRTVLGIGLLFIAAQLGHAIIAGPQKA